MKLYGYWRSSASYRTRIALHYKKVTFEYIPVHLVNQGGEQHSEAYKQLNPAELVPTLVHGDFVLNQSLAIIDYLEAIKPSPSLIPEDPQQAALVKMLALDMAADLQPITNLRVLQYLSGPLEVLDDQRVEWIKHWVHVAFQAFEKRLEVYAGRYCFGDTVTLADVCLVPQVYNAIRFQVDLSPYPKLKTIHERLNTLDAFIHAHPSAQPDAQE